jgi:hypothetical protein
MDLRYFVGLDLGQRQDFTAVAVVQRTVGYARQFDHAKWMENCYPEKTSYSASYLERMPLGMAYPDVVERVRKLLSHPRLAGAATLVVDGTGVGAPVVDLLRRAGLGCPIIAATITGGDRETRDGDYYRVPKRDLIAGLQVMLQQGELAVAARLPEAPTLVKEMLDMRVKISAAGHDSYSAWREGAHDDLVLALALAVWQARIPARSLYGTTRLF